MMRKIITVLCMILILLPSKTYAITVGDTVGFSANTAAPEISGSSSSNTVNSEEAERNAHNQSVNRQISNIVTRYISGLDTVYGGKVNQGGDRYVIAYDVNVPKNILQSIASFRDWFDQCDVWNGFGNQSNLGMLTPAELQALLDAMRADGFGNVAGKGYCSGWNTGFRNLYNSLWRDFLDEYLKFCELNQLEPDITTLKSVFERMFQQMINEYWDKLFGEFGGHTIRYDIIGGENLVDFYTQTMRYKALKEYLNYYSGDQDYVKMVYIVEYKGESTAYSTVKTAIPLTWGATGQTHFWEFNRLSTNGGVSAPLQKFAGPQVSQTFYYAGEYNVKATQIIEKLYYDAITYSRNEYLVIADTNQIVWKNEVRGSQIDVSGVPMDEQNLVNPVYHTQVDDKIHYITQLDQNIHVNDTTLIGGIYEVPSAWGDSFSTERIE